MVANITTHVSYVGCLQSQQNNIIVSIDTTSGDLTVLASYPVSLSFGPLFSVPSKGPVDGEANLCMFTQQAASYTLQCVDLLATTLTPTVVAKYDGAHGLFAACTYSSTH